MQKNKTISIDTPLAEITLRRYEKSTTQDTRELIRRFCLSMGLLQPGDSRDIIVDVFYALLNAKKQKKEITSQEIEKEAIKIRKNKKLSLKGTAPSNIRRQLKRLRDLFLIEKLKSKYRITEFNLKEAFNEKTDKFLIDLIKNRIKDHILQIEEIF